MPSTSNEELSNINSNTGVIRYRSWLRMHQERSNSEISRSTRHQPGKCCHSTSSRPPPQSIVCQYRTCGADEGAVVKGCIQSPLSRQLGSHGPQPSTRREELHCEHSSIHLLRCALRLSDSWRNHRRGAVISSLMSGASMANAVLKDVV